MPRTTCLPALLPSASAKRSSHASPCCCTTPTVPASCPAVSPALSAPPAAGSPKGSPRHWHRPIELISFVLELQVQTQAWHNDGPPVAVIPRILHILQVKGWIDASPEVQRVIALDDIFAPVIQPAVPQKKPETPIAKVESVIMADSVADEHQSHAIRSSAPPSAIAA